MTPSVAPRPARFSALAMPFFRSSSMAFSTSPPVSSRAALQSIMPAPVRCRSAATSFTEMVMVKTVSPVIPYAKTAASEPSSAVLGAAVPVGRPAPVAPRLRWPGRLTALLLPGRLLGLEPGHDGFGLGPPPPPGSPPLPAILLFPFRARIRAVGVALGFLRHLAQWHLGARFGNHIHQGPRDQGHRANGVVVAGDRHGNQVRVRVGVYDGDDRNPQLVRLGDRDALFLGIHHEQRAR